MGALTVFTVPAKFSSLRRDQSSKYLPRTSIRLPPSILDRTLDEGEMIIMLLKGKRVFIRVNLNVLLDGSLKITDNTQIRVAVPMIMYLRYHDSRVILCSHLRRPKGANTKCSLKSIVPRLSELLE